MLLMLVVVDKLLDLDLEPGDLSFTNPLKHLSRLGWRSSEQGCWERSWALSLKRGTGRYVV